MTSGEERPRPPRRKRYRGTHPRKFDERYKELDAARFPDEAEKVRARGDTPAGTHRPVLLAEILAALSPAPGETVLDCTLGHGGHAEALALRVAPGGLVLALDHDAEELARTAARLAATGLPIRTRHANFAGAAKALRAEGIDAADVLLADLGVSSMQIDRPERGFSFKEDGPLDMRMDRAKGVPASQWLAAATEWELAEALRQFGDEPHAAAIAAAVKRHLGVGRPLDRTLALRDIVLGAQNVDPATYRQENAKTRHPAARTFQALRIVVNREMETLAQLLRDLPWILRPGGRAGIITFHSGEERLVVAAFERGVAEGLFRETRLDPVRPSPDEVRANPRSRSARLWWVVRA